MREVAPMAIHLLRWVGLVRDPTVSHPLEHILPVLQRVVVYILVHRIVLLALLVGLLGLQVGVVKHWPQQKCVFGYHF